MYKSSIATLITIFILSFYSSCRPDPSKRIMSPEVRYMSDTMFANRRLKINEELDSLCALNTDQYQKVAIDSLLLIERRMIKELSE